ncbi:MAG: YggS family pyridoxal phosphate-dependent enzyme [Proteobacteria bacterium]|nr:YggS family pyridoxal phosphate-dependent enzyme [Pseudomonadota bacterium]
MSLSVIKEAITKQELNSGLGVGAVNLIAVSKMQPEDRVRAVLKQGHSVFGENKVQEATSRWSKFKQEFSDIELHLLGPLQSNKVRQALELFDFIHSLDGIKLAKRIAHIRDVVGKCPKLFIQVNTGDEPQKSGVRLDDLDELLGVCSELSLPVIGLMCIPPADLDPKPHFDQLYKLAYERNLTELSMGMSGDFNEAISSGATYIRVGSAIFGERP